MTVHAISPHAWVDDTALEVSDDTALPLDGWRLRHRVQPDGRAVLEIIGDTGDLVGLIASTNLPMLSVDAAWRGMGHDFDGARRWWALAVGHDSGDDGDEPIVTFSRRAAAQVRPRRVVVRPRRTQGLWIASVPGLYTAVSCQHGSQHAVRRLATHR